MAQAKDLTAMGMPAELAKRAGFTVQSVTTTSTAQNSGGVLVGPGNLFVDVTPHASNGAVTLPNNAGIGDVVIINNNDGTNAVQVYPQTGGTIQSGSANTKQGVAAKITAMFIKFSATNWKIVLGAAATPS
jgi:hypothetical protein